MVPLAAVTRNKYVESIHYGCICVVDSSGEIIYQKGDADTRFFFRSAAKPIQVLPFIKSGGAGAMDYSLREIAIACASHTGEERHQKTVLGVLDRLGLDESSLHCGTMIPYNEDEHKRLIKEGHDPSPLHASCSGKHAAMLAYSKYLGCDISNYEDTDHPVQKEIIKTIGYFTDEKPDEIPVGTDGCGLPIFLLPARKMALSYARLVRYAQEPDNPYHEPCKTVFEAMTTYPEMVAGSREFCTELMSATKGKLIGKIGAEAVYCLGIKKGSLGVCVKIADGGERAVYPVVIQLLLELGILDKEEYEKLEHWHNVRLMNNLKEHIGYIIPVFQHDKPFSLGMPIF
ncbi:MAG TPA: asparaginase [Clostridiaceae bacterium]|nr:asparaginase [Clostridiaceae bacterium]